MDFVGDDAEIGPLAFADGEVGALDDEAAIEGGLRLLPSSATRRAALAAPATAPAQPERKPMTKGQREQVARRAEAEMNGNVNLSWRDALMSETEAFHGIKEQQ